VFGGANACKSEKRSLYWARQDRFGPNTAKIAARW
jgi:hypothetical protein